MLALGRRLLETGGVMFGDTEEAVGIDGATVAVAGFKGLDDIGKVRFQGSDLSSMSMGSNSVTVGRKDKGLYVIGINKLCCGRPCFCHFC